MAKRRKRKQLTRRQRAEKRRRARTRRVVSQIKQRALTFIYTRGTGEDDIARRAEFAREVFNAGLSGMRTFTYKVWVNGKWQNPRPKKIGRQLFTPAEQYQTKDFPTAWSVFKDKIFDPYQWFEGSFGSEGGSHTFDFYPRVKLIIAGDTLIRTKKLRQVFRDGEKHCLLHPLLTYFKERCDAVKETQKKKWTGKIKKVEKLIEKYDAGMPEELIQEEVVDKFKVGVKVHNFLAGFTGLKEQAIYEARPSKGKMLKMFTFVNPRLNHVEVAETLAKHQTEVSREELYAKRWAWEEDKVPYCYKDNTHGRLSTICSKYGTFIARDPYREAVKEWESETGLGFIGFNALENWKLATFVRDSILETGTIDFCDLRYDDPSNWTHLDQTKAFANSEACPYYEGFLGKITDFRRLDGVSVDFALQRHGLWKIKNINTDNLLAGAMGDVLIELNWLDEGIILPTPEIRFWLDYGATFDLVEGCWGVDGGLDVRFNETMKTKRDCKIIEEVPDDESDSEDEEEETEGERRWRERQERARMKRMETGPRYYCKYVGEQQTWLTKHKISMKATKENEALVADLVAKDKRYKANVYLNAIELSYPRTFSEYKGHFASYIKMYQRLSMMFQLAEVGIDRVGRICVDGLYCQKRDDYKLVCGFREKDGGTFRNAGTAQYITGKNTRLHQFSDDLGSALYGLEDEEVWEDFDLVDEDEAFEARVCPDIEVLAEGKFRDLKQTVACLGAGGTGKTYTQLSDKGFVKPVVFVAPSYNLAYAKKKEFDDIQTVGGFMNLIGADRKNIHQYWHCGTVVVDEVSMLTEKPVKNKDNKNTNNPSPKDEKDYAIPQSRQEIEKVCVERGMRVVYCGDIGYQLPPVVGEVMNPTTCEQVLEYKTVHRFKCGKLKMFCEAIRAMLKNKNSAHHIIKYVRRNLKTIGLNDVEYNPRKDFVLASTKKHCAKITEHFKEQGVEDRWRVLSNNHNLELYNGMIVNGEKPPIRCELSHCSTIHGIQGNTCEGKLFILDSRLEWQLELIYTAVSRARFIDQIYLLKI